MANILNQNANNYWSRLFQPNTSTSTTTVNENEDIDLASLLSMLMFLPGLFGGNKSGGSTSGVSTQGTADALAGAGGGGLEGLLANAPGSSPLTTPSVASALAGANSSQAKPSPEQLMSILLQLASGFKNR